MAGYAANPGRWVTSNAVSLRVRSATRLPVAAAVQCHELPVPLCVIFSRGMTHLALAEHEECTPDYIVVRGLSDTGPRADQRAAGERHASIIIGTGRRDPGSLVVRFAFGCVRRRVGQRRALDLARPRASSPLSVPRAPLELLPCFAQCGR